jgi:hypothetical protein
MFARVGWEGHRVAPVLFLEALARPGAETEAVSRVQAGLEERPEAEPEALSPVQAGLEEELLALPPELPERFAHSEAMQNSKHKRRQRTM